MTSITPSADRPYLRIATEDSYAPPDMISLWRDHLANDTIDDIGFTSLVGYVLNSPHPQPQAVVERLQDAGERRIADMDAAGIDHQVMALTAPGTQVLNADEGQRIARLANDKMAQAVAAHPTRLSALAAVSYEDPTAAVAELQRAAEI